ncbi:hypothetical protein FRC17_005386, partial [Serendipita sp. 399]
MGGTALPPGLRFPTGAILGHYLVIAGTYLAHSYQSFSIWALDLISMTWSRIDPGATLSTGSWSRGVLWENGNRFLIFGNKDGNLVEDYNRRLLSWDHAAYIDLEAFGIYRPPELSLSLAAQELGLAALEEGTMADFELVCDDGRRISCSRRLLEDRWPWFRERRREFVNAVTRAMETMPNGGKARGDVAMPEIPGVLAEIDKQYGRPDPRLTPRAFHLSEPYAITLAFLQWMYAQALITRLQHTPPVLSALLLLATTYKLEALEKQVKHAMHRALNAATSVGVYEVATLCDCQSLQIRALKVVMSSSRQRSNARPRHQGGPSGGGGHGPSDDAGARPRGMSDAPNMRRNGDGPRGPPGSGFGSGTPQSGPAPNGYITHAPQQLKLAITVPSLDGHSNDFDEEAQPDPQYKFGVTTPYTQVGTGASIFETSDMLPSAIEPQANQRARMFQPRRKDSAVSGAGSDSGSSTTAMSKFAPKKTKGASLRPTTTESAVTDMTERTLIQSESEDGRLTPSGSKTPPAVADARMRRLLHELDSIGLTDEMSIGRASQDIDEWATSSSIAHGVPPTAPLSAPKRYIAPPMGEVPPGNRIVPRPDEIDRLQRSPQARQWQTHSPSASLTRPNLIPPHRSIHPDAPETASPASPNLEVDDSRINPYLGTRPDVSPLTAGQSNGFPRQGPPGQLAATSPLSRPTQLNQQQQVQSNQQQHGFYQPAASAPLNSSAFPMPPRLATNYMNQQAPPLVMRSARRPGTAGGDPPVAFFNNPLVRGRHGSDQNLREKYLSSATSASQGSSMGLSPISPMSAPAMTISTSVSRTNSTKSGALETPIDGIPLNGNPPYIQTGLDPIQEKRAIDTPLARDDFITSPGGQSPDVSTPNPASFARRGSLDSGT